MLAHWYTLLLEPAVPALTEDSIAAAVWASPLPASNPAGSAGAMLADVYAMLVRVEKMLRNKQITDPVAGTMTVYDDDGSTVLLTGPLFEDAAGVQAYRGQGADRRERLA